MSRRERIGAAALVACLALLPAIVTTGYHRDLLCLALIWVVVGTAWNLLGGYAGQVSFGHAAFFGTAAYATAFLTDLGPVAGWSGLVVGGLAAGLLSIPIGAICFRLRGPYFALSTLAVAEVLRYVAKNPPVERWTMGDRGLQLPIVGAGGPLTFYYVALALAAGAVAVEVLFTHHRLGYWSLAVREDQDAAEAIGIPTTRVKGMVLFLSAALTGAAGSLQALRLGQVFPEDVYSLPHVSVAAILIVMLGGVASRWGPVLGAFLFVAIEEGFRTWIGEGHLVVFGAALILVIVFLPRGLVHLVGRRSGGAP